jgi:hypothetical protein
MSAGAIGHSRGSLRIVLCDEILGVGQAGEAYDHLLPQRGDEEMVLVFGADFPGVGESVHVDFLVSRLAIECGWRCSRVAARVEAGATVCA